MSVSTAVPGRPDLEADLARDIVKRALFVGPVLIAIFAIVANHLVHVGRGEPGDPDQCPRSARPGARQLTGIMPTAQEMIRLDSGTPAWISGAGRAIIFIHGVLVDHRMWQAQVDALSPHYRVCCIDMLGHGEAPDPPGEATQWCQFARCRSSVMPTR